MPKKQQNEELSCDADIFDRAIQKASLPVQTNKPISLDRQQSNFKSDNNKSDVENS